MRTLMTICAAAVALGCRDFDKRLTIAGVIFNNVGGTGHYDWLRKVLETRTGMTSFGYLVPDRKVVFSEVLTALPLRQLTDQRCKARNFRLIEPTG